VSLYRDGRALALTVFNGWQMPQTLAILAEMQPGRCASYFYER